MSYCLGQWGGGGGQGRQTSSIDAAVIVVPWGKDANKLHVSTNPAGV
jgi:hypothetical protein